ncbi:hypothetical protein [Brevundimonas viscosa]|uniref:Uncharacterized protein n=1 Tax=Brevundimonas viscosa TaxID=871741 RepID=A0A1I6SMA1_9CAUL|nr:hypothetical protein [Brevundimonas viscosa]SFS78076.1 hypothetical protein SAMN05192570_2575 [Brevundimonas viscosa]
MDLSHRIDEAKRRVFMTIRDGATGPAVVRYIAGLAAERPELAGWDWVQDVRESSGEVDNADIQAAADIFGRTGPCWTVFVSHDPNLRLWCRVMDALFDGRRHLAAATPEAAAAMLESLRAETSLAVA